MAESLKPNIALWKIWPFINLITVINLRFLVFWPRASNYDIEMLLVKLNYKLEVGFLS